jgi:hypothetical protein
VVLILEIPFYSAERLSGVVPAQCLAPFGSQGGKRFPMDLFCFNVLIVLSQTRCCAPGENGKSRPRTRPFVFPLRGTNNATR